MGVLTGGQSAVLVEVNCETDFVAKGNDFKNFVHQVATTALGAAPPDVGALRAMSQEATTELTLKCGEKVDIRRYQRMEFPESGGLIGHYCHGGKIGVLVNFIANNSLAGNSTAEEVAKDVAMQVAASDPRFVSGDEIDEDFKQREADIYAAQLAEQGRPQEMIAKIVAGKLKKLATEVCLLEQKFVKDPSLSVGQYLEQRNQELGQELRVTGFCKFNLGEGITKKADNLAEEVAKMTGQ